MRPFLTASLFALLVVSAPSARADLPPVPNSTIPGHVVLVGRGPAGPDSASGHCTVTVRDLANNPIVGSVVTFDFSACTDMAPAVDQRDPRLVVHCGGRQVSAVTDANGIARFTVLGSATGGPPSPAYALGIYADGVLLGHPPVSAFERDGVGGLTVSDLSAWAAEFFSGAYFMRGDFNANGDVSVADLSIWAAAYFNGANTAPIGTLCP